jgi:hypothetical protein
MEAKQEKEEQERRAIDYILKYLDDVLNISVTINLETETETVKLETKHITFLTIQNMEKLGLGFTSSIIKDGNMVSEFVKDLKVD